METVQDYPSSYTYITTQNQNVYYIPSVVLGKAYVKVIINGVTISSNVYDVINNSLVLYFKPLDGLVLQIKVASSVKGITQLDFETSQEAVLDAIVKMNALIKNIDVIKNVRNNLTTITNVVNNMVNTSLVSSSLQVIKSISDKIRMFDSPDIKNHNSAINRNTPNSHTMESITGLIQAINSIQLAGVFPTRYQEWIEPNKYCLSKINGEVKQLQISAIQNRRIKLLEAVSPYSSGIGCLNSVEGIYKNNINKSMEVTNRSISPISIKNVESSIMPYHMLSSYLDSNSNTYYATSGNIPLFKLVDTLENKYTYKILGIDILNNKGVEATFYYYAEFNSESPQKYFLPIINNTPYDTIAIINLLASYGDINKRIKINDVYIIPHHDNGHLLRFEYKVTQEYPLGVFIINPTPYYINTSLLNSINNILVSNKEGGLFFRNSLNYPYTINDITANIGLTMHNSIVYNGNTYTASVSANSINAIDSYNYRYFAYVNFSLGEIIYVDYTLCNTTQSSTIATVAYRDTETLPILKNLTSSTTVYIRDFDLRNKRFIIGLGTDVGCTYYIDALSNTKYPITSTISMSSVLNMFLLPRDKEGNIYIGYITNTYYFRILRNNLVNQYIASYLNNYQYNNMPRGGSTYGGTRKLGFVEASKCNINDLHLLAQSTQYFYI